MQSQGPAGSARRVGLWLLCAMFILSGCAHFAFDASYASAIPPELPAPLVLVWTSGALEIVLGALALPRATRRLAGFGLMALSIAVFPANIYMATHAALFPAIAPLLLWWRLPLQAVIIAWAAWACGVWPKQR